MSLETDDHIQNIKSAVLAYRVQAVAAKDRIAKNFTRSAAERVRLRIERQTAEKAIRSEAVTESLKKYADTALDLIARLDQDNILGGGVDSQMLQAAIKNFTDI